MLLLVLPLLSLRFANVLESELVSAPPRRDHCCWVGSPPCILIGTQLAARYRHRRRIAKLPYATRLSEK
uniref:Putative secreted protein n=1 Tax=Anopheles marajoara TaxID=58244 RepID=A0A2M4CEZ7_9DIPT